MRAASAIAILLAFVVCAAAQGSVNLAEVAQFRDDYMSGAYLTTCVPLRTTFLLSPRGSPNVLTTSAGSWTGICQAAACTNDPAGDCDWPGVTIQPASCNVIEFAPDAADATTLGGPFPALLSTMVDLTNLCVASLAVVSTRRDLTFITAQLWTLVSPAPSRGVPSTEWSMDQLALSSLAIHSPALFHQHSTWVWHGYCD